MSGLFKRPKAPEPTQQEIASVARQQRMLDEETGQNERRLKAVARGRLGSSSLLASATAGGKASASSSGSSGGFRGGASVGGSSGNRGGSGGYSGSGRGGSTSSRQR